jgi:sugar phosphate isomerase/epimerase
MFFHEYTIPEIFSFVSLSGLDGIEFWLETPHFWLRDLPVNEIMECRKAHPELPVFTVHAPVLDLNPCSINPDIAEVSIEYAIRAIAIAEQAGARVLTVHPGRRTAKRPPGEADFIRFAHYLDCLRNAALKDSLRICMENLEPAVNSLISTPEQVRSLLDNEPWLYFTLDVSHAMKTSEEEPLRFIELCHERLSNVHISRAEGTRMHLPLDRHPAIARVLWLLKEYSYHGSLTLEIEDLNYTRALSADEKIALLKREGAFLRECMA